MRGSKHSTVRTAIRNLTSNFRSKLRFGLATFGATYRFRVGISDSAWSTIYNSVNNYPSNEAYTRMATAIRSAGQYLWSLKRAEPSATRNRPYYLVLITDGYPNGESLNTSTEARTLWRSYGIKTFVIGVQFNASVLNAISKEGQTGSAYNAGSLSSLNSAFTAIANTATKEICDNLDNDCDGRVDEGLSRACNSACGAGRQVCSKGRWGVCAATNPPAERCNGRDDDCDGKVDENWPTKGRSCAAGTGGCRQTGTFVCSSNGSGVVCSARARTPQPETCNGRDDDCDGQVDERLSRGCRTACGTGTESCSSGRWVGCTAQKPVPETCNGRDDDCDGKVDETWPNKGSVCSVGQGICRRQGTWGCKADKSGVECSARPGPQQVESCNGKDDDCDGQVDENWPNKGKACENGTGACRRKGQMVCKPDGSDLRCSAPGGTPSKEVCDGVDNDCNGKVDDGLNRACQTACGSGIETCQSGQWVNCNAPRPKQEICNDTDDNCDGQTDEGLTRECKTACGTGREQCLKGQWVRCSAQQPKKEDCNGIDDDCNGKVDEMGSKTCRGDCGKGLATCVQGQWSGCSQQNPKPESCDGVDNDCDGRVDENLSRNCRSDCGSGKEICQSGKWMLCNAPLPQPERCNGRDDDCDGKADNAAPCPSGMVCIEGNCQPRCRNSECPGGMKCVEGICRGDACKNVRCPASKVCVGGRCTDPCSLVNCPSGFVCRKGNCLKDDCYVRGCLQGQRCVAGLCQSDPCSGVNCPSEQFCRNGQCVKTCAKVKCKQTELCVDGQCKADPKKSGLCEKVSCPDDSFCEEGRCVRDPCYNVNCSQGKVCRNGRCQHDLCHNIECPNKQVCRGGQCVEGSSKNPENPNSSGSESNGDRPDGGASFPPEKPNGSQTERGDSSPDSKNGTSPADKLVGGPNNSNEGPGKRYSPGCACEKATPGFSAFLLVVLFLVVLGSRRRWSKT